MNKNVDHIFPNKLQISDEFRIDLPFNQKEYLIDGELHEWNGDFEKVFSPVYIEEDGGFDISVGR